MIDINAANAITIGIFALIAWALVKFGASALNLNFNWLN